MNAPLRPLSQGAASMGAIVVLWLTVGWAGAAEPDFPPLSGRVVDAAGILSPKTSSDIAQMLAQREQATGDQVVVATVNSLQGYAIEDFGVQLGRHWGIGQKGRDNGAILLVAPSERKVRIEVGYGLEARLTDAQSRVIIDQVILPAFRRGDFDSGVRAGAAAMLKVLGGEKPDEVKDNHFNSTLFLALFIPAWCLIFFGVWGVLIGSYLRHRNDPTWLRAHHFGVRGGHSAGFFSGRAGGFGGGLGGGFSGGGGSFGGGGASGGW